MRRKGKSEETINPTAADRRKKWVQALHRENVTEKIIKRIRESAANVLLQTEKKICGGCKAPIVGAWVGAMGQSWHPEHFICQKCKKAISGGSFNVESDRPYCKPCHLSLFGKKCKRCNQLIEGGAEKTVIALDSFWHLEHFTCETCKKLLNQKQFFEKENLPYCKDCFEKNFCPTCKGCKKPISDTILSAADAKWHKPCFKCFKCKIAIGTGTFGLSPEGNILCDTCLHAKPDPKPKAKAKNK